MISEQERLVRIKLNSFSYLKTDWILKLIELYGSAGEILKKTPEDISNDGGISLSTAKRFLDEVNRIDPEKEIQLALKIGAKILVPEDLEFPELLKKIYDVPLVLYVKGEISSQAIPIAIVGTRKPTTYGRKIAFKISSDIAKTGMVVVSGLARGIDTESHAAVLKVKGKTWAVLGTGLNKCYPWENRKLADKIVETGGALISEFPLNTGPMPVHFPRRNRIISGLSYSTIVVEGRHNSGALITARMALEQGREIFAVPGPVDSEMSDGPNKLIKDGAMPLLNSFDVVSSLPSKVLFGIDMNAFEKHSKEPPRKPENLSQEAVEVLKFIEDSKDGVLIDEIVAKFNMEIPRVASFLFELETNNLISSSSGKYKIQ